MVNVTEHRAAMHMALRSPPDAGLRAALASGIDDASKLAAAERDRMRGFVTAVHDGSKRGATGERFTAVVNIGIGGSDLGPRVATEALTTGRTDARMDARFLSNVDGHAFLAAIQGLDPARTLFLVASKTFTTLETQTNAHAARDWIAGALGDAAVGKHFAALSTNLKAVAEFGIAPDHTFGFRDWVGGRYSLWSPVGLVIALAVGWEKFQAMLDGAWAMDCHFRDAPLRQNLPVLLGAGGHVARQRARLRHAMHSRLRRPAAASPGAPATGRDGEQRQARDAGRHARRCRYLPMLFGEPGTNAQHSFMQLVHQGTRPVPVDFILAANPDHNRPEAHRALAANAFAQAEALLRGRSEVEVRAEMTAKGASQTEIDAVAPHRVCVGERPSNTIMFGGWMPFSLGRLIALYEHKVAVQGCVWGIDSFDQWGVELGKELAGGILPELAPGVVAGRA